MVDNLHLIVMGIIEIATSREFC